MILVIGCGNLLMGDDGFGIHVLEELEKSDLPENIKLIDIGTSSLDILHQLEGIDKVIIIDAVKSGNEPGVVYRLTEKDLLYPDLNFLSLHELKLEHTLSIGKKILGKKFPKEIIIFGVEVERIEGRIELSPKLKKVLPKVVNLVFKEIK